MCVQNVVSSICVVLHIVMFLVVSLIVVGWKISMKTLFFEILVVALQLR